MVLNQGENVACLRGFEPPTFGSGASSLFKPLIDGLQVDRVLLHLLLYFRH
jgi:hypothetical protein